MVNSLHLLPKMPNVQKSQYRATKHKNFAIPSPSFPPLWSNEFYNILLNFCVLFKTEAW